MWFVTVIEHNWKTCQMCVSVFFLSDLLEALHKFHNTYPGSKAWISATPSDELQMKPPQMEDGGHLTDDATHNLSWLFVQTHL